MTQGERLALFSEKVRASSIKRFRLVKPEDRSWRPAPGRLSFVDHLKHLVDCDRWILAVVKGEAEPHADIKPGEGDVKRWDDYLSELEKSGLEKAMFIRALSDGALDALVEKPEHLGRPDAGSLILRANLDHEVHHRGMIQLLLKLRYG
jgi:uncharacterized damage-inducible protein DinB